MPARILREGILTSESVDQLSLGAELFYRRLMSAVDDYGRFPKHPSLLRAALFPLRTDKLTSADISGWLDECKHAGLIQTFLSEGKTCIEILNFKQRRRSESKYPRVEDSPMPDKCQTDDGQMRTNASTECEGEYRRRVPNASLADQTAAVTRDSCLIVTIYSAHSNGCWDRKNGRATARCVECAQSQAAALALEH